MSVDPATANPASLQGAGLFLLLGTFAASVRSRTGKVPATGQQPSQATAAPSTPVPMHREIRGRPGSCPICGMAPGPEQVSLDDAPVRTDRHDEAVWIDWC